MRRLVARVRGFGWLGVALLVAVAVISFLAGAAVVANTHFKNLLEISDTRTRGASSEVPRSEARDLATRFRPWLKFDSQEHWRPLNISTLFEERRDDAPAHQFCQSTQSPCEPIADLNDFEQRTRAASAFGTSSFVNLAGSTLEDYYGSATCGKVDKCDSSPDSTIYYHVTQANDRFYVDYWWFFRFNHFDRLGADRLCGSQDAIDAGICDEHEGDWEGVTAVTAPNEDKSAGAQQLDYVVYAAHKGAFRYSASPESTQLGIHDGTRPDVYVARGSHASYPVPCSTGHCEQPVALAVKGLITLPEANDDGEADWDRNADCAVDTPDRCLLPLPRVDQDPQAWTVWKGQWGAGCSDACHGKRGVNSPASPGQQARYQTPDCSRQGGTFSCDRAAVGCDDWLGPLVRAVACDPTALADALSSSDPKSAGPLTLKVNRKRPVAETTPGVVQALGAPLEPEDRVVVTGATAGDQILVRAQQGRHLVEARFVPRELQPGGKAIVRVRAEHRRPKLRLDGRRPVEQRVLKVTTR